MKKHKELNLYDCNSVWGFSFVVGLFMMIFSVILFSSSYYHDENRNTYQFIETDCNNAIDNDYIIEGDIKCMEKVNTVDFTDVEYVSSIIIFIFGMLMLYLSFIVYENLENIKKELRRYGIEVNYV